MHSEFKISKVNAITPFIFLTLYFYIKPRLQITSNGEFDFASWNKYDVNLKETSERAKHIPHWLLNQPYSREERFIVCALPNKINTTSVGSSDNKVYKNEIVRVATFTTFPHSCPVDIENLAHNGFIYMGFSDCVICHICAGSYCNWQGGENIRQLHATTCPFRNIEDDHDIRHQATNSNDSNECYQHTSESASSSADVSHNTLHQTNARHSPSDEENTEIDQNTQTLQMFSGHLLGVSQESQSDRTIAQASDVVLFQDSQDDTHRLLISSSIPADLIPHSPFFLRTTAVETESVILHESSTDPESEEDVLQLTCGQPFNTATPPARSRFLHPNFTDVAARIGSFRIGGSSIFNLAANGFWFDVKNNSIRCFSCGFSLENWVQHPDPLLEHQIYGNDCTHLLEEQEDISRMSGVNYHVLERLPSIYILLLMDYSWDVISVAIDDITSSEIDITVNQLHANDILERIFHIEEKQRMCFEEFEEQYIAGVDLPAILEENQHLKDDVTCKICCIGKISVVLLPCGHLVCCGDCFTRFHTCPVCRQKIQKFVHATWSRFKKKE